MTIIDIINKKKFGGELNEEEIRFFTQAAAHPESGLADSAQLAALLMAIRLMGMTDMETALLTLAMRDSGDVARLDAIPGVKVDKHSSGGVGDTTTLILAPLVAACGVPVAKMSGRGLGHTGGTLDKMESVPGLSVSMSEESFVKQVLDIGIAVIGQTGTLAPADKTLYALRDVTGTVDSLPLIVSSIMSKKLASGADAIVLDVKTGSGAIMQTVEKSAQLARKMVDIGRLSGKKVTALVTDMSQPLGTHVGNALQVKDAIDVLSGRTKGDLLQVSLALGSEMLVLAGCAADSQTGRAMLQEKIANGQGLEKLKQMIRAQGGDPAVCDDVSLLPQPGLIRHVKVGCEGWISAMDTTALGMAAQAMGAGRIHKSDIIDPAVGFILPVRIGDHVMPQDELVSLWAKDEASADAAQAAIRAAVTIGDVPAEKPVLIYHCFKAEEEN